MQDLPSASPFGQADASVAHPLDRGRIRIALVSLGCPKNLVDSESMSGLLRQSGYQMVSEPAAAHVIVINTCGFLQSAVQEAIRTILDMAELKQQGSCDFLIVTGCMPERYTEKMMSDLPEVDALLGVKSFADIVAVIEELYAAGGLTSTSGRMLVRKSADPARALAHLSAVRPVSTGVYAYMKVSEGCNNRCAYCAIPGIRGRMQSRPLEDLVREAGELAKQGVKEIILVAQDTTGYGVDIYKERKLAELIRLLLPTPGIERIRFLYAYANGMTDELLHLMAAQPKVLPYIDLPIQHASDAVLHRMRRTDTQAFLRKTFARIRTVLPQAVLRTTVMVGFPGETEEEFTELYEFVKEIGFDHLGAFIFSPEEGTEAAKMPDQVPLAVAEDRYERIMTLQRAIAAEKNHILIDNDHLYPVLIESVSDDGIFYIGRTDFQAPEIDSLTYVVSERELQIGEICPVTLVEYSDYDLIGVCKDEFT